MTNFSFFKIAAIFNIALFFLYIPFSSAQDIPAPIAAPESGAAADGIVPLRIKVDVNEVRLDVVVVDKDGRQITDLTAEDFEVYQDKRQMAVTSSIYINLAETAARSAGSRRDSPYLPEFPVETPKEEDINRTIFFIVDNASMEFEHLYWTKMGINLFVENQMLPGDLVAIMRTGYGNSALDMFSADKRQITARAALIPYDNASYGFDPDEARWRCPSRIYAGQLDALSYSIGAMKDMPGRKIIFLITSCPTIESNSGINKLASQMQERGASEEEVLAASPAVFARSIENPTADTDNVLTVYNRLADDALRANIVVHALDAKGLETRDSNEALNFLNPMVVRTGGKLFSNNFFLDGIGNDANNMIAGYYLVSYVPPPNTFDSVFMGQGRWSYPYHRVQVKVKRKDAEVYARDGFYANTGNLAPYYMWRHPLQNAIMSPFKNSDIEVNVAAGYAKDARAGYLIRSWVHVDPKDVQIIETDDGTRIDLEVMCLTSDSTGYIRDSRHVNFSLTEIKKPEVLAWIMKHGIRFSMLLPVKKPGFYSVRVAVKDVGSGKVGSSYQFVEVTDIKKEGTSLSNIFMIASDADLAWMNADAVKELSGGVFFPVFQGDDIRTPALRTYMPGDNLQTLTILYSVDTKAVSRSEIQMQSVLYKDGKEFLRGDARLITAEEAQNPDGIPILQKLSLSRDMPPGEYTLQLLIINKKTREKEDKEKGIFSKIFHAYLGNNNYKPYNEREKGLASQALNFRVTERLTE